MDKKLERQPAVPEGLENQESQNPENYYLESLLVNYYKVNEGNKGIIGRVDLSKLSPKIQDYWLKNVPEGEREESFRAIKMLKIYLPYRGRQEAVMHERAAALIRQKEQKNLVKVPRLYFHGEVNVTNQDIKSNLESQGVHPIENKVYILLMDFVQGIDFATYLYQEVVLRHPDLIDLKECLDRGEEIDFQELQERVQAALGFSKPGGKERAEGARFYEQEKVETENRQRIIRFLQRKGFILDKDILERLKLTISLFHENKIYHQDLQERNFMLKLGPKREILEAYIVDFGAAAERSRPELLSDSYLGEVYAVLTVDVETERKSKFLGELEGTVRRLARAKAGDYEKLIAVFDTAFAKPSGADLFETIWKKISKSAERWGGLVPENVWKIKLALFQEILSHHPEKKDYLLRNLSEQRSRRDLVPLLAVQNLIRDFCRYHQT